MDKARKIIAILVLIDFVYATINWVTVGLWLPLIPAFELIAALIFLTSFFSIQVSKGLKWGVFLPLVILFLAHSELTLNLFLNSEQLSFYSQYFMDRIKLVTYLFLLLLFIVTTLLLLNSSLSKWLVIPTGLFALLLIAFGYSLLGAILLIGTLLFLMIYSNRSEIDIAKNTLISHYALMGYTSLLLIQSTSFYFVA